MTRAELEDTLEIVVSNMDCLTHILKLNEELIAEVEDVSTSLDTLARTLEYLIQDRVCKGELSE